ncbi:MAG: hypothetical protein WAR57_06285 [Candidatus Phosphoribacter sp.]
MMGLLRGGGRDVKRLRVDSETKPTGFANLLGLGGGHVIAALPVGDEPDGLADAVELCHRRGRGVPLLARLHQDVLTVQIEDPQVYDDPAFRGRL